MNKWCEEELSYMLGTCRANALGCMLWQGGPDNTVSSYGRKRIKYPGYPSSKTEYVHRVAYKLHHKTFELEKSLEVSHLCHNHRCINPSHLVLELHEINSSRLSCKVQQKCTHGHTPFCIFMQ